MLPDKEHRRKVRQKRARKARAVLRRGYSIVRPLLLVGLAYGGGWLFVDQLRRQVWHHNMIVWAVGLFLFFWGLGGLYLEVSRRVRLRRWLGEEDPRLVMEEAPRVRKAVDELPPWHMKRYLAKKRWARKAVRR